MCDGIAPPETIECAQEFARHDPRVKVLAFPKGERIGEAHLHTALTGACGNFVAYLEDDDLWFPNHLEELEQLLLTVEFGHTIHVTGTPGRFSQGAPVRSRKTRTSANGFLDDLFSRFGYSFCGHRLDAYRRLPEGWVPTPLGMYPDLHMWRKFLRMNELKFGTRMVITAVALPSYLREHMSLEERASEGRVWISRILDEQERAKIVEAAWRSVVGEEIQSEQEILKINSSFREAKVALAHMPKRCTRVPSKRAGMRSRCRRTLSLKSSASPSCTGLSQHSLSLLSARTEKQEAALAAYQADLADLNARLAECKTAVDTQAKVQLELEHLTALYNLSQQDLSLATEKASTQEAAITVYQADLIDLTGRLTERKSAYERITGSVSWRLTRPFRSVAAAVRHLSQVLLRDKKSETTWSGNVAGTAAAGIVGI